MKTYIGDSVYADMEGDMVKLTTENGFGATNTIYLEPRTWQTLIGWMDMVRRLSHGEDSTTAKTSKEKD